mmetsp:Transcript_91320/g.261384  ORF Transcript_91320/g.261384 Transcript_91320/m.261384 type:complete len:237 (+) Transcript_91320:259-969(+)
MPACVLWQVAAPRPPKKTTSPPCCRRCRRWLRRPRVIRAALPPQLVPTGDARSRPRPWRRATAGGRHPLRRSWCPVLLAPTAMPVRFREGVMIFRSSSLRKRSKCLAEAPALHCPLDRPRPGTTALARSPRPLSPPRGSPSGRGARSGTLAARRPTHRRLRCFPPSAWPWASPRRCRASSPHPPPPRPRRPLPRAAKAPRCPHPRWAPRGRRCPARRLAGRRARRHPPRPPCPRVW